MLQKARRRLRRELEHFLASYTAGDTVDPRRFAATTPCCVCGRKVSADEAFEVEWNAEGGHVLYCAEHAPDRDYLDEPPE